MSENLLTVGELIDELLKYPRNLKIEVYGDCYHDGRAVTLMHVPAEPEDSEAQEDRLCVCQDTYTPAQYAKSLRDWPLGALESKIEKLKKRGEEHWQEEAELTRRVVEVAF